MTIIKVIGFDPGKMKRRTVNIDVGLTCFCESYSEYIEYLLSKALTECKARNWEFQGFEIVAC